MPFSAPYTIGEAMAARISQEVRDNTYVATGAASAIPMAGVLLAKATHAPDATYIAVGATDFALNPIGDKEFFDLAQRGKLDLFFLGGAQIDAAGNLNLTTIGSHDAPQVRFPGAAGSGMLYYMTRRVILFRLEHTRRVFVPRVDFITTPGSTDQRVHRPGGPTMLITNLCVMRYLKGERAFELESVHPGVAVDEVLDNTGFEVRVPPQVPQTAAPTPEQLRLLRTKVKEVVAREYPQFVRDGGLGEAP